MFFIFNCCRLLQPLLAAQEQRLRELQNNGEIVAELGEYRNQIASLQADKQVRVSSAERVNS
jgi:hypothetical protein